VAFEMIQIILTFKQAEDDKLMKFQRAAQFTHVPPDPTTVTLYKYMALRLGIVTFKPKVILPDDSCVLKE
jgi:hypothetical protein